MDGKKTYIAVGLVAAVMIGNALGIVSDLAAYYAQTGLSLCAALALRHAIAKLEK